MTSTLSDNATAGDALVSATLYTDPLCCWSYAMQHSIEEVQAAFGTHVQWRIRLAGMIPDWKKFSDPVNNVARPSQMGPLWMYVSEVSQVHLDSSLWVRNPPASSYPACLAFYAAMLQHADYGWPFLKLLWQCCMNEGENISERKALTAAGKRLQQQFPFFDPEIFDKQLNSPATHRLLQDDMMMLKMHRITRLPSIVIKGPAESLLITGYHPPDLIREAFLKAMPTLQST
ncbi:MAG: DsbA family oxidoreductase [Agriterribacter sp.]